MEIVTARPEPDRHFAAVVFDFDGTLSLLRRNWQDVMIPMMVDILLATGTTETAAELGELVEQFVMRLNGRQTIYQMMQLCDEVRRRGAEPRTPLQYKADYHDRLWVEVAARVESVRQGTTAADEEMVAAARALLQRLVALDRVLYLASGTDLVYVEQEARVLGIEQYFGPRIYGALDDYKKFSKAMILARIVNETGVPGSQVLGFGDGFVEIEEIKRVGGYAVGVASDENRRPGINSWKRKRLIDAGADLIIADYQQLDALLDFLNLNDS